MKYIKYGLIYLLVILPFYIVGYTEDRINYSIQLKRQEYTRYLKNAVEDASQSLLHFSEYKMEKEKQSIALNIDEAIQAFFNSLFLQLGMGNYNYFQEDTFQQTLVKGYIPVIVIIDYDGFYIYSANEYTVEDGSTYIEHTLLPKQYYTMVEGEKVIHLHLDGYIKVYDVLTGIQEEGHYNDLGHLIQQENFEVIKRNQIIQRIEESLNYHVNLHNEYALKLGIAYDFYLPRLSKQEWENCIRDIGVMAFFQGIPLYKESYLNIYSVQGSRILKRTNYMAYKREDLAYYCKESCLVYRDTAIDKVYNTRMEAAKDGYYPCLICNP